MGNLQGRTRGSFSRASIEGYGQGKRLGQTRVRRLCPSMLTWDLQGVLCRCQLQWSGWKISFARSRRATLLRSQSRSVTGDYCVVRECVDFEVTMSYELLRSV